MERKLSDFGERLLANRRNLWGRSISHRKQLPDPRAYTRQAPELAIEQPMAPAARVRGAPKRPAAKPANIAPNGPTPMYIIE